MRSLLEEALPPHPEAPVGLIVPHAGYLFSGPIAADAFNQAAGHLYDLVVIFGTNHTTKKLDLAALPSADAFATPLGDVVIPRDLVTSVLEAIRECVKDDHPHDVEHSIEVQLPFLQVVMPKVPILPIVIGSASFERCHAFGERLAQFLEGKNVLYIASSDLSHYPTKATAREIDEEVLQAILSLDSATLQKIAQIRPAEDGDQLLTRACGSSPIHALLGAVTTVGATAGVEISYANSGDTIFGEDDRVVGYSAMAFYRKDVEPVSPSKPNLPLGTALLKFARRTLEMFLNGEVVPLPRGFGQAGMAQQGAFVSLYNGKQLRGCVGHITSDDPLALTVGKVALAAAEHDWRFTPVTARELPDLTIEISVLTKPKSVATIEEIKPGRDGVMIRKGNDKGVFLPKVAEEQGWNREELLAHLCRKADLPAEAWRDGADLLTFQAEVFKE